ncbi:MAG TPA: hypothetical protein VGN96_11045, partial [Roseococcus sp.]|nr:hypothetical protein [Roseococcus sp.]
RCFKITSGYADSSVCVICFCFAALRGAVGWRWVGMLGCVVGAAVVRAMVGIGCVSDEFGVWWLGLGWWV